MSPHLQQIKQIFHCVFFPNNIRSTPSILNNSQTLNITMYVYKMVKKKKGTKKMKNLQNNPGSRPGWMGQNQGPVPFTGENARDKKRAYMQNHYS